MIVGQPYEQALHSKERGGGGKERRRGRGGEEEREG